MTFQVVDDDGNPIDAHYEVEGASLVLHSRGGSKESPHAQNTEYSLGLRTLLTRIQNSDLQIESAWVDSSRVQNLSLSQRQILSADEGENTPEDLFKKLSSRMVQVGRSPNAKGSGGNSTKRIRIAFLDSPESNRIAEITKALSVKRDLRSLDRLPVEELNKVTSEHIWKAVSQISLNPEGTRFGASTDYDVIGDDERRFPPKAVFGVAASEALGFEVLPRHFSGGVGTPCFRSIESAGYEIVTKFGSFTSVDIPPDPDERTWTEGGPRLVTHLRRERGRGLSRAKKAEFTRIHGKLFCERCKVDPKDTYGEDVGDACIEVHHAKVSVSDMDGDHVTTLEELQCLCANCHRVVHKELREQ